MAAVKQRAVKEMGAKRAAGTSQADVGLKLLPAPGTGLVLNAEAGLRLVANESGQFTLVLGQERKVTR